MINCDDCQATWAAYGEETPCGGTKDLSQCDQITEPLLNENAPAWALYSLCRDQTVMGVNGPVALSLPAVVAACDLLEIPAVERLDLALKVRAAWHAAMGRITAAKRHQAKMQAG